MTRQISESIAAQECPRGCYECWPGVNRQRLWNQSCSGTPEDVMDGCGLVRPGRLQNLYSTGQRAF